MITFLRTQRTRILWVVVIVIILLVGLGYIYRNLYSNPRRVFNAMLNNSLRTTSVTKQVIQDTDDQTLDQKVRIQLGGTHLAHGVTRLTQSGLASATVMTESLGTPYSDYVRYRSIDTDQKNEAGDNLDFSQIVGRWGRGETAETTTGELYNELVLGVIPIGNLSADDRKKIIAEMSELDVYKVEYENVQRGTVSGRPAYQYTVKVLPDAYVTLLKSYADKVGLTHLKNINPRNYSNADPIEFKVSVDIRTRRLAGITYQNGRQENYLAYGSNATAELPSETVSIQELQSRLQNVQ